MKEYIQDDFYDMEKLPFKQRMELVQEAMELSDTMFVDESKGWQRVNIPNADPYKWVEKYPKPGSFYRFIHRKGYAEKYHIQVVINEYIHYLWINLDEKHLEHFVKKYKLTQL